MLFALELIWIVIKGLLIGGGIAIGLFYGLYGLALLIQ